LTLPLENDPSAIMGRKKIWWRYARFLTRGCPPQPDWALCSADWVPQYIVTIYLYL